MVDLSVLYFSRGSRASFFFTFLAFFKVVVSAEHVPYSVLT